MAECNYTEVDKQLKGQFIDGVNDNDMLKEIINKLAKKEKSILTSEKVLAWPRKAEAQRYQTATVGQEKKYFDTINSRKMVQRAQPVAKTPKLIKEKHTMVPATHADGVQHMGRWAETEKQIT